jgi:hypothetical protein
MLHTVGAGLLEPDLGLEETDAVARRCWTCFTKAYVVPAVIRAPRKREAGRWNFERGIDGNLIRGRDGFGRWEDHDVGGEVMGVLTSSFWSETSAEVLEVSEHFSLLNLSFLLEGVWQATGCVVLSCIRLFT